MIVVCIGFFFIFIYLLSLSCDTGSSAFVAARRRFSCGMRTLSCSMEDLGPCPRIELSPSALRAQRASHLATGQVPYVLVLRTCRIIFLSSCTIFFPLNLIFLFMFSFSFTVLALNLPSLRSFNITNLSGDFSKLQSSLTRDGVFS